MQRWFDHFAFMAADLSHSMRENGISSTAVPESWPVEAVDAEVCHYSAQTQFCMTAQWGSRKLDGAVPTYACCIQLNSASLPQAVVKRAMPLWLNLYSRSFLLKYKYENDVSAGGS